MSITDYSNKQFKYDESDCGKFVFSVVAEKTGRKDIVEGLYTVRGYRDEEEAEEMIRDYLKKRGFSYGDIHPYEALCRYLFGPPVSIMQVKKYGVVVTDWGEGMSFGLCYGNKLLAVTDAGIRTYPLREVGKGWNIV